MRSAFDSGRPTGGSMRAAAEPGELLFDEAIEKRGEGVGSRAVESDVVEADDCPRLSEDAWVDGALKAPGGRVPFQSIPLMRLSCALVLRIMSSLSGMP